MIKFDRAALIDVDGNPLGTALCQAHLAEGVIHFDDVALVRASQDGEVAWVKVTQAKPGALEMAMSIKDLMNKKVFAMKAGEILQINPTPKKH